MSGPAPAADPPGHDDSGLADIVRAASAGDRDAWGALYERFGPLVHGLALSYADPDDAADLAHDAFVHAFERVHTLREPRAFGAWIAQIARNMARMRRRGRLRIVPLDAELPARAEQPALDDALDGQRVLAAIRDLPEAFRETLVLRLVEGLSGVEIAAQTGMTHGSVRVNLHRGLTMLQARLGEARGGGDTPTRGRKGESP